MSPEQNAVHQRSCRSPGGHDDQAPLSSVHQGVGPPPLERGREEFVNVSGIGTQMGLQLLTDFITYSFRQT